MLVFARVPYFRAEDNEPLAQRRHPRHFFYLDRIHPVKMVRAWLKWTHHAWFPRVSLIFSTSPSYEPKREKRLGFLQIQRSWRTRRLDTRMILTYGHRWVRSCRFEQLKASKALLKSITKSTVRKDNNSLTKTWFWFTKRPCFSPWSTNILFWKIYIWNISFAEALYFYP